MIYVLKLLVKYPAFKRSPSAITTIQASIKYQSIKKKQQNIAVMMLKQQHIVVMMLKQQHIAVMILKQQHIAVMMLKQQHVTVMILKQQRIEK